MKKATLILLILSALAFQKANAQRIISGVTFHFRTTSDDKDHDTGFELDLKTANDLVIASGVLNQGDNVYYGNDSDHDFNLNVDGHYTEWDLNHGKIDIRITPNGHDTWKFDLYVYVYYTNGEHSEYRSIGWTLTQDDPTYELRLE